VASDDWQEVPLDDWEEVKTPRLETGVGDAFVRGAAQGASLGFADELTAAVGAAKDAITSPVDYGIAYEGWKSAIRRKDKEASDDQPLAYGAGTVTGGVGTAFIPGMAGTGVAKAAGMGAASGAGFSEADPTKSYDDLKDFAGDVALGGALGGVGQAASNKLLPLLGKAAGKVPEKLSGMAERQAFKAAAGTQEKAYDEAVRKGIVNRVGRDLLDDGIVTFGANARGIAERADAARGAVGSEIDDLLRSIDDKGLPLADGSNIATKVREYAAKIDAPNTRSTFDMLAKQADEFESMGRMPLTEAQRLKNSYKWDPRDPQTMAIGKEASNELKRILGDELEDGVRVSARVRPARAAEELATGSGPTQITEIPGSAVLKEATSADDALTRYLGLKEKYGSMATAKKAAEKLANRQEKNRLFSLTDYLAGGIGGGLAGMNPAAAGAAAVGNKVLRERGPASLAVGLDKVSKILSSAPDALGKYASVLKKAAERGSLGVTHAILMQQDPEYQALVSGD
jgi:hypothetical protein